MGKIIELDNKLTIRCGICLKVIGNGQTYGYTFFCDACNKNKSTTNKVQIVDINKNSN